MAAPEVVDATQALWGESISGKYRVERVLGEGGMGVILEATHVQLEERVAIKMLRKELATDAETVKRFLREARAAIKIRSEHVVRVHDVGSLDAGMPYIVMELLEGVDLERLVFEKGAVDPANAVDYVLQACEALAEAHVLGMVHRDLKPANLFLTHRKDGSPCVKVLDFGITKVSSGTADFGITRTQAIFGSPKYMSPEQMRSSREVDARSDIWGLGTILYELLSGRTPFEAETMPTLCALVLGEPPPPLPEHVPHGLSAVVMRCLRKDPNDRFSDVGAFARALAPFGSAHAGLSATRILGVIASSEPKLPAQDQSSRPAAKTPPKIEAESAARFSGETSSSWGDASTTPPKKKRWAALIAVAGAGVVVASLVGYVFATRSPRPAATPKAVVSQAAAPAVPAVSVDRVVSPIATLSASAPELARTPPLPTEAKEPRATPPVPTIHAPTAQTFAPVKPAPTTPATATTTTATTAATTAGRAALAASAPPTATSTHPQTPPGPPSAAKPSENDLFQERK
jgi:serine/threonine-protein kinase